jgi:O-antigen ligase
LARIFLPGFYLLKIDFVFLIFSAIAFLILIYHRKIYSKHNFFFLSLLLIPILNLRNPNLFAINFIINILFYLLIFILTYNYLSKKFLKLLIILSIFLSVLALLQYFYLPHLLNLNQIHFKIPHLSYILTTKRTFATFISPDLFAQYLLIIIPISIISYTYLSRPIYLLQLLLIIFALFSTKSIGALAIFMVGNLFNIFYCRKRSTFIKRICFLLLIITILALGTSIYKRANLLFNPHNLYFNPFYHRLLFWKTALKIIRVHPILGIGTGNFAIYYKKFMLPHANETVFAHNIILQFWAEQGIAGLLLISLLYFLFLKDSLIKLRENYSLTNLSLIWAGINFLLHNLIDIGFYIPQTGFLFWVIWALLIKDDR